MGIMYISVSNISDFDKKKHRFCFVCQAILFHSSSDTIKFSSIYDQFKLQKNTKRNDTSNSCGCFSEKKSVLNQIENSRVSVRAFDGQSRSRRLITIRYSTAIWLIAQQIIQREIQINAHSRKQTYMYTQHTQQWIQTITNSDSLYISKKTEVDFYWQIDGFLL